MRKAIVLTSGGLDSQLAMHVLKNQGVEVVGLHCYSWFTVPKYRDFLKLPATDHWDGFLLYNLNLDREHTQVILHPVHGYGSAANPCIDCKLLFMRKARELMDRISADFVATGEVLGQRPMTQRMDSMRLIERDSGLEGYLLRPLSALLLPETVPEREGWVNRDKLYAVSGRGRKSQIALAKKLGVCDYPSPAGGCLVTEKNFQKRFLDLTANSPEPNMVDLILLKYGRHFRLSKQSKLVVGKHQQENEYLRSISHGKAEITAVAPPGPFSLLDWDGGPENLKLSFQIIARYCIHKSADRSVRLTVRCNGREKAFTYTGNPSLDLVDSLIVR
jgi:tRNA U34 2-thiouridine synthase MnmA/TrmU